MSTIEMIYGLKDLNEIVAKITKLVRSGTIITFVGSLGAGKTTLIKALLKECGVLDPVISPTFSYVNAYSSLHGKRFFHFDLYRLDDIQQFIHAGFDEYLEQPESVVLIEWPEIIKPLLAHKNYVAVVLDYVDEKRKILITEHNIRGDI